MGEDVNKAIKKSDVKATKEVVWKFGVAKKAVWKLEATKKGDKRCKRNEVKVIRGLGIKGAKEAVWKLKVARGIGIKGAKRNEMKMTKGLE